MKLRELPGGHTACDYFGHILYVVFLGTVWVSAVGAGQPLCSLTDDLLYTSFRSLIRTLPILSWTFSSGMDSIRAGHADGANQGSSHGAFPQTISQRGFLFWSLGDSPLPGQTQTHPTLLKTLPGSLHLSFVPGFKDPAPTSSFTFHHVPSEP